jgi:ABC-type antimicrobial peptide transport system ATPase subunit
MDTVNEYVFYPHGYGKPIIVKKIAPYDELYTRVQDVKTRYFYLAQTKFLTRKEWIMDEKLESLSTEELISELALRIQHSNGLDFVDASQALALVASISQHYAGVALKKEAIEWFITLNKPS